MKNLLFCVLFSSSLSIAMLGGVEVKPNDPLLSSFVGVYALNKESKFNSKCTGTIIGKKTVLTAAHCLTHLLGTKNFEITLASSHFPYSFLIDPKVKTYKSNKFKIFQKYFNFSDINQKASSDVAIIFLEHDEFLPTQRVLPLIFPGALNEMPLAFQIYSTGDPDLRFKKQNFLYVPLNKFQIHDPLSLYKGVNGGFFLVNHPVSRLQSGDSGSTALTNRYGVPTIMGVLGGGYILGNQEIGYNFANLNEPEINKWIRSQMH